MDNNNEPLSYDKDTTSLMKTYNFNNPVNVMIIYEDEEKNKEIYVNGKNVHVNLGHNPSAIEHNWGEKNEAFNLVEESTRELIGNNIEEHMLNQVAQNILYIAEAYLKYCHYNRITNEENRIQLKNKYLDTKCYYFNQSFAISKLFLVPRKRNKNFIRIFLNKIFQKIKVHNEFMAIHIRPILFDLLKWTETKMNSEIATTQKQALLNETQHGIGNLLNSNSEIINNHLENRSNNDILQKGDTVTLFSSGSIGNEVIISVDSKYIRPNATYNDTATQNRPITQDTYRQNEMQRPRQNIRASLANTAGRNAVDFPRNIAIRNSQVNYVNQNKELHKRTNITNRNYNTRLDPMYPSYPSTYQESVIMNTYQNNNNVNFLNQRYITNQQHFSQPSMSRDSASIGPVTFNLTPTQKNHTNPNFPFSRQDVPAYNYRTPYRNTSISIL